MSPASASSTPATGLAAAHTPAASAAASSRLRDRAQPHTSANVTPSANVSRPIQTSPIAATANTHAPRRTRARRRNSPSTSRSNSAIDTSTDTPPARASRPARRAARTAGCSRGGVTRIPVLVEHAQPRAFVQSQPIHLRGQIGRARIDEQPQHQQPRSYPHRDGRSRGASFMGQRPGATPPSPGPCPLEPASRS